MRIKNDERESWQNTWANTEFSVSWANKTLKAATQGTDRFVLFCDNLSGQVTNNFKDAISSIGGLVWYEVPNAADLWQPVDAGFGQLLEVLTKQEHNHCLDCDENAGRWYGDTEPFSAKERRILITHWVGNAYSKLPSEDYKSYIWRMWGKKGCLITADGSEDKKIEPEGLSNYEVRPPIPIKPNEAPPCSNFVDPMEEDETNIEDEENQEEEGNMLKTTKMFSFCSYFFISFSLVVLIKFVLIKKTKCNKCFGTPKTTGVILVVKNRFRRKISCLNNLNFQYTNELLQPRS